MRKALLTVYFLFQCASAQHTHTGIDRKISFPDIKGYKTLSCDLHTHTVFSDGSVWPSIRVAEANKDGLDAIAVTEHIEYQSYKEDIPHPDRNRSYDLTKKYAKGSDLMVIAGTEITKKMPPGHANAIFVKDVNKIMNDDYMKSYEAARKQGAFTFWNHPHWIGQRKDASVKVFDEVEELINKRLLHGIEVTNERTYSDQAIQAAFIRNRFIPGIYVVAGLSFGMLVSAGGWILNSGEISVGQFVTFLLISTRMTMPLFILGLLMNQLQRGEAAARRVFALIDLEPSITDSEEAKNLDEPITSISFPTNVPTDNSNEKVFKLSASIEISFS